MEKSINKYEKKNESPPKQRPPLTALIRAGLSDGMRRNSEPLARSSFERIGEQANEIERQAGSRKKKYHVFCSRRMLEVGLSVSHFYIFS
jgi:hypothetical protein